MRIRSSCLRFVTLVLAVGLLLNVVPAEVRGQSRPLKILLTNDDGFEANGLKTMQAALIAAGHQVTVVAPAVNQSSTGMAMTSGVIKFEKKADGVWAVYGTPADSALIGLKRILADSPPDLVVSGTNQGQNIGTSTNSSGTVNAAQAAAYQGVPAIATSAGTGANAAGAYLVAASIAVQMIAALDASRPVGGRLLPENMVINVNVPAVAADRLLGLRLARLSRKGGYTRTFAETGTPNEVRSQLVAGTPATGETDTDLVLFSQGYATMTLLDGDVSVDAIAGGGAAVAARIAKVALPH